MSRKHSPSVVVSIVEKDGKVLMIERRDIPGLNGYIFPGGKVETAETIEQAAEREVWEETSVTCRAVKELGQRRHPKSGARMHYWLCDFIEKSHSRAPEFPILWAPVEYLDALAGPTLSPVVKAGLKQRHALME